VIEMAGFGMRQLRLVVALVLGSFAAGCGGGVAASGGGSVTPASLAPVISPSVAQGGAEVVTISSGVAGAKMYYTLDGTTPTSGSTQYLAPFLVASNVTLHVIAQSGGTTSAVVSETFSPSIASGTLIWSDEFTNTTGANAAPNPAVWTYDTGNSGFGNQELETYCAYGSNASPCNASTPNVYVGTDGYLHIQALSPSSGVYTSARLKTQGLLSMPYGRLEARMQLPEGQGFWPAFWLMGNNYATAGWPICGEMDVMEHINQPTPDAVYGSVHMTNGGFTHSYSATGFSAAAFHTYGMIWTPGQVEFYVDSPSNYYAVYTSAQVTAGGGTWPFDSGNDMFILLNLAVGGTWPGSPNSSTVFPAQMLVDYVRIYTN